MKTFQQKVRDLISAELQEFPKSYFDLMDHVDELNETIAELRKENEEMQGILKWEGDQWSQYFKVEELERKVREAA